MWILGIAGSHNSGAALIKDGKVVVAVQTERLVRVKRQAIALDKMEADTGLVIAYCLHYAGIGLCDLEAIATCTPGLAVTPQFALQHKSLGLLDGLPPFITTPHHLAHAEYALHYSPQIPCLVLVCDGSGTCEADRVALNIQEQEQDAVKHLSGRAKESISAYRFDGRNLKLIYRVAHDALRVSQGATPSEQRRNEWLASLGHLWEWAALYCHGSHHEAGKVMGLAPFGDPGVHAHRRTASVDTHGAVKIDYVPLMCELRQPNTVGADVSGITHYEDIAAHVQNITDTFLVDLVRYLRTRYDTSHLCYAGGVALNGVANEHLCRTLGLDLHMNGSCEDNGTAIGAALAACHALTGKRVPEPATDYYGRSYSSEEVAQVLRSYPGTVLRLPRNELLRRTSHLLVGGQIVGWFQGRSEFGPRALGNRSILADPRNPQMQKTLNERVKHREAFRPYAPAVVERRAVEFFDLEGASPAMLRVVRVKGDALPAIKHVDGTARVQTVNRCHNEIFHDLLEAFEEEARVPVLLNTSFNVSGEPIVETPADALRSFTRCSMDALVMEDHLILPPSAAVARRSTR